jgi:anthranilate phosphoribosyltransferase
MRGDLQPIDVPINMSRLDRVESQFGAMLGGEWDDDTIAAALIALAEKGETAEDIAGAARAMRARMVRLIAPSGAIDVCGTGGDGSHSLNVSTAVSIVVAACDVSVAKHGNRAASSKAGAADTLEALGLDLDRATATAAETLADLGLCFLFAQRYHPALARIALIRRKLERRTIFNLLGPLANPAGVTRQLVGVPTPALLDTYAAAMRLLGTDRALIVSGAEGLDELSVCGPSYCRSIGFSLSSDVIAPEDVGLVRHKAEALRGGDAAFNAAALRRLLLGEEGAYRDAVLFNAAGALMVADHAGDWQSGIEEAAEAIDKGLAKALLDCWVRY